MLASVDQKQQIYYTEKPKLSSMSVVIKVEEFYEDLSTALSLIKKKLKNMLNQQTETGLLKNQRQMEESILSTKCAELISKYKYVDDKVKVLLFSIMNRFQCRVKEIIKQVGTCIPKNKIQLLILTKKIQILILKIVTFQNAAFIITSLLEMINNSNLVSNSLLKIKTPSRAQQKQLNNQCQQTMMQYASKDIVKSVCEAEIMLNHTQKYDVIDLDRQYLRGKYFDLKQNQESATNQQMGRNKIISQIIGTYEKQYARYQTKNNCVSQDAQRKQIKPISWQIRTIESENSNLLQKSPKRIKASRSVNSSRNQMNRTYFTINNGNKSELTQREQFTLRSVGEEKHREKTKYGVKVTNFILNDNAKGKSSKMEEINVQRWRFFKKSQDHLKYRYKYLYQNRHSNSTTHSFKNKAINPEIVFNTINYA